MNAVAFVPLFSGSENSFHSLQMQTTDCVVHFLACRTAVQLPHLFFFFHSGAIQKSDFLEYFLQAKGILDTLME